jgi:hypothetical protein
MSSGPLSMVAEARWLARHDVDGAGQIGNDDAHRLHRASGRGALREGGDRKEATQIPAAIA